MLEITGRGPLLEVTAVAIFATVDIAALVRAQAVEATPSALEAGLILLPVTTLVSLTAN